VISETNICKDNTSYHHPDITQYIEGKYQAFALIHRLIVQGLLYLIFSYLARFVQRSQYNTFALNLSVFVKILNDTR